MTLPAHHPDTVPPRDDIAAHLIAVHHLTAKAAHSWSGRLVGLPWRYIRPIVAMAASAKHDSPIAAMLYAAQATDDETFRQAIHEHTKDW